MKRRINDTLWHDQHGIYANRGWDGRFSNRWSPTSFLPLLAGIPDAGQAQRLVQEHLLNKAEFWGRYVIPSVPRNDPAYPDNDYWRGRIWGPFNYLVAEGLRRYRFDTAGAELARRGLEMFLRNWREDGGVYENYNADTGRGADVWNAARLYHWGGLLALVAIQELVDSEPAGYLRFGSMDLPDSAVRNFQLAGASYDVEVAAGVQVRRNGQTLLECPTRAIVRLPVSAAADALIEIGAPENGSLALHSVTGPVRRARVNGARVIDPTIESGIARYAWT
jgi:glycogen debranching enzyme